MTNQKGETDEEMRRRNSKGENLQRYQRKRKTGEASETVCRHVMEEE